MSVCNDCKHRDKNSDQKPCNVCMQYVDGYLEATSYELDETVELEDFNY
jgi:hypothetical protein